MSVLEHLPLVTCIMPTRDRRAFVRQSLDYFRRQTYPRLELIVVDDGNDSVADVVRAEPRARYVRVARCSVGEKRNRACGVARGEIIVHWDDDDWYGANRVACQVQPLLDRAADVSGLGGAAVLDAPRWQAWHCAPELHRRLFVGDVHGGTLAYWRSLWERCARFPNVSLAEDALFLREVCRQGARLARVEAEGHFVYVRHGANAWQFEPGAYLGSAGWRRVDPATLIPALDRAFYTGMSRRPGAAGGLVTCIMPTADRRQFVPRAIDYFMRQDYEPRELLVLDDGQGAVGDLMPADPRVRYVRLKRPVILGAKRNLACELASGEYIAHWDDDDWAAPHRLSYQVDLLEQSGADVCGIQRELYFDPLGWRSYLYEYPPTAPLWLAGNALLYRAALWRRNPFPSIAIGEDAHFVRSAASTAVTAADHTFQVGLLHDGNTAPKLVNGRYWRPVDMAEVEHLLGSDLDLYRDWRGTATGR